ncbi:hypothetical protein ACFU9Y_30160, partial [Streptomyces sp. NPDC057621]
MKRTFLPQTGIFGPGCVIVPPAAGTFGLAGRIPAQQAAARPARAPRRGRSGRIKLAITAFAATAGATFGFIATGTDPTTAVGGCTTTSSPGTSAGSVRGGRFTMIWLIRPPDP